MFVSPAFRCLTVELSPSSFKNWTAPSGSTLGSHRQPQAMAYGGAAAMVDTVLPVRGFSTQFPLGRSGLSTRMALFSKHSGHLQIRPPPSLLLRHGKSRMGVSVSAHLGEIPGGADLIHAHVELAQNLMSNFHGSLITLADAAVSADGAIEATGVKQDNGWLGGLTDVLEKILIFLKDGLSALNVPYAYGFSIILLTLLVKAATYPLTKSQVESTIAMQNLQPKIKAIQARYQGDQERIQLETARLYKQAGVNPLAGCLPTLATLPIWIGLYRALSNVANEGLLTEGFFWIPSLAGPTTIAARNGGSGVAWLFPLVDGVPPLGWNDTIAYLILPVLLVGSQFVSMQLMQPPQTDPSQKNTQLILKFLPLMIGYFSLSVPSGLSLYWLTNNILSTAQQVYLRRGTSAAVADASTIITAGQAKRSTPPAGGQLPPSAPKEIRSFKEDRRGERFKELKKKEAERKAKAAAAKAQQQMGGDAPLENNSSESGSAGVDEEEEDGVIDVSNENEEKLEVFTSGSGGSAVSSKRGKRSKRTRSD
ncbi:unnamed protein product [Calypogeia fissa]